MGLLQSSGIDQTCGSYHRNGRIDISWYDDKKLIVDRRNFAGCNRIFYTPTDLWEAIMVAEKWLIFE